VQDTLAQMEEAKQNLAAALAEASKEHADAQERSVQAKATESAVCVCVCACVC